MTTPQVRSRSSDEGSGRSEFSFSDADFKTISAILYEDAGIVLKPEKAALVYSRLTKRLRSLGLENFGKYCTLVGSQEGLGERREMLAALTTNVTHFFREQHHFDHLRNVVLPHLIADAKNGGRVRLWSAGCSNGHEPYSIAMTVLSMIPDANRYDIKILASDIDPHVVAFGREGLYDDAALENVPSNLRSKFFSRRSDGRHSVSQEMRDLVAFRELNLMGQWPMKGTFQVIFCRNVTIYFDEPARQKIWGRFCDCLETDGMLYIGHSERVTGSAASRVTIEGTTTYRAKGIKR